MPGQNDLHQSKHSTTQQEASHRLQSDILMHHGQPDLNIAMSRGLWSSVNPGYVFREGQLLRSVANEDFRWDANEVQTADLLVSPWKWMQLSIDAADIHDDTVITDGLKFS